MDISVIMIDGGFRENVFGAEYFSRQDFPEDRYEIIWVDFYDRVNEKVRQQKKVKTIALGKERSVTYHSSFCFNKGIEAASGELIVIPDADQVVMPDFLSRLWQVHSEYEKLVVYPHRYDELKRGSLHSLDRAELEQKCGLINPLNYGGCLSVRKKWLMEINGYEQHRIFESGFHANGLDVYTRFRNYGMAIMWAPGIRLYHPWHEHTLHYSENYLVQQELIKWRSEKSETLTIDGISSEKNTKNFSEEEFRKRSASKNDGAVSRILRRLSGKA